MALSPGRPLANADTGRGAVHRVPQQLTRPGSKGRIRSGPRYTTSQDSLECEQRGTSWLNLMISPQALTQQPIVLVQSRLLAGDNSLLSMDSRLKDLRMCPSKASSMAALAIGRNFKGHTMDKHRTAKQSRGLHSDCLPNTNAMPQVSRKDSHEFMKRAACKLRNVDKCFLPGHSSSFFSVATCFPIRSFNILPKNERHRSPQVACPSCLARCDLLRLESALDVGLSTLPLNASAPRSQKQGDMYQPCESARSARSLEAPRRRETWPPRSRTNKDLRCAAAGSQVVGWAVLTRCLFG